MIVACHSASDRVSVPVLKPETSGAPKDSDQYHLARAALRVFHPAPYLEFLRTLAAAPQDFQTLTLCCNEPVASCEPRNPGADERSDCMLSEVRGWITAMEKLNECDWDWFRPWPNVDIEDSRSEGAALWAGMCGCALHWWEYLCTGYPDSPVFEDSYISNLDGNSHRGKVGIGRY